MESSHIPPPNNTQPPNTPQQSGALITTKEPTRTRHYQPKSQPTLGFTLGGGQSVGLDKGIMTCVHHYSVPQSSFAALNILCALSSHPFLPTSLWQPLIFLLPPQFCLFQNVLCLESYSTEALQCGFFCSVTCVYVSPCLHGLLSHFSPFSAEQYSMVQTRHCLFTHSLTEGHLVCFRVLQIMNQAAINIGVLEFV